ncbi:hypothetical protein J6590_000147 [Homalodisca vitripennis]|nr:hypothetical protein J6590_000147 [Homalodisca vitripennis]
MSSSPLLFTVTLQETLSVWAGLQDSVIKLTVKFTNVQCSQHTVAYRHLPLRPVGRACQLIAADSVKFLSLTYLMTRITLAWKIILEPFQPLEFLSGWVVGRMVTF